jgi:hypothetical protein
MRMPRPDGRRARLKQKPLQLLVIHRAIAGMKTRMMRLIGVLFAEELWRFDVDKKIVPRDRDLSRRTGGAHP